MDIYAAVTDRIIEQMEQGISPWQKPWISNSKAISHATGKPYSLLNQLMLGRPGEYLTFKQCQQAGGKVKKGAKSSMVVFWKFIEQEDEETHEKKEVPFLRYYNVFHIDQYTFQLFEALCHLYGGQNECVGAGAGVWFVKADGVQVYEDDGIIEE